MAYRFMAALAAVAIVATGSSVAQSRPASATAAARAAEIRTLLDSSAAAWNRGDVRAHLAMNADSIELMTRQGPVVGNDSALALMTQSYFREGQKRLTLRFDHVSIRPLGRRFALAVGQFILTGEGKPEQSGWFSTVWEHRPEGWRVIHDHSS